MNILFSAFINPERKSGVDKKIYGQIKAFRNLGHRVWYFTFEEGNIVLHSDEGDRVLFAVSKGPIGYYMALEKAVRQVASTTHIDAIYIRRIFCTPFHLKTLKILKAKGVVTVEEIPTYPYDNLNKNFTSVSYKMAGVVDKICRKNFKKYLDCFTTYTPDDMIFGVPAISLDNGIDFDNVHYAPTEFPENRIDMIEVSAMAFWHGYERVIEGMAEYYTKPREREIYFHLVGTGTEDGYYKSLVEKYNLGKYVIFHGHRTGDSLNKIFAGCQLAFGSLGLYKANLDNGATLKNREYMAMGKPYIFAHKEKDPNLPAGVSMCVSNDATPVDMDKVLEFYDSVKQIPDISLKMHKYALDNYGWDVQLKKVEQYINSVLKG